MAKSAKERECDQLIMSRDSMQAELTVLRQQCEEKDSKIRLISEDKAAIGIYKLGRFCRAYCCFWRASM